MNMKKLMAGVVAGALAVSTLAASAFADSLMVKGGTIYNATVTYSVSGTVADSAITIPALTITDDVKSEVTGYKADVTVLDAKGNKLTGSKSTDKNEAITFSCSSAATLTKDFGGVNDGAEFVANIEVKIKNMTQAYTAADEYQLTADQKGKLVVNDNTAADDGMPTKIVIGTEDDTDKGLTTQIKKQTARDLNAEGAKVTLKAWINDGAEVPAVLKFTITNTNNGEVKKTVVLSSADEPIVLDIPAGFFLHTGDENEKFDVVTITCDHEGFHDADWKWGFWAADLTAVGKAPAQTEDTSASDTQVSEDDPTNTSASDTQAPASSDDNGNTNAGTGDDKNQPTGVALAVIPAIVAAAGVVIAKKRG